MVKFMCYYIDKSLPYVFFEYRYSYIRHKTQFVTVL